MPQLKLVKIGLYARVSSDKQAQDKTIDSQVAAIIEHAQSLGEKIDPDLHFTDNGVSGASLERPGLDRLRDKSLAGEVTKVYILSPDRLARKSAHQILIIEEMQRLGINFSFVNRAIGDTPEDQMLLQIQGIISEYEREKILERSRRGKLYAAQCGKVNVLSGAPYGYFYQKKVDGQDAKYIIHPHEALVVKEAFELYCKSNMSLNKIAKHFTTQGYITKKGNTYWDSSSAYGILKNPAYTGLAGFRKTKTARRIKKIKSSISSKNIARSDYTSRRNRPEEDWIYIPVPAIIDKKIFDIAQQKLQDNIKFASRNRKNQYLLSGLLRCKTCGYAIYGRSAIRNKLYYRCKGQDNNKWPNGKICTGHPVRTEVIDGLVWESIKLLLLNPDTIINEYKRRLNSHNTNYKSIIDCKQDEINRFSRERNRLIDLFQTGLIEKEEIEVKLKTIRSKIEQLNNEINYLMNQDRESEKLLTVIRNLDNFSESIKNKLDFLNFEQKRDIIRFLVEEVEVDTINDLINIKHIIPLDPKKYLLRSEGHARERLVRSLL